MRTREEIENTVYDGRGRPIFESGILEALLDIRDLLATRIDTTK